MAKIFASAMGLKPETKEYCQYIKDYNFRSAKKLINELSIVDLKNYGKKYFDDSPVLIIDLRKNECRMQVMGNSHLINNECLISISLVSYAKGSYKVGLIKLLEYRIFGLKQK